MTKSFHPDLLQSGDMVRHYKVVRRLGSGGFASVFLVESGGRPYTMKIAARPPGDEDEAREDERAFREAISLGHFRHPKLLTVLKLGRWPEIGGRPLLLRHPPRARRDLQCMALEDARPAAPVHPGSGRAGAGDGGAARARRVPP